MADAIEIFIGLLILLAVVTVVGHGIWVGLARLLGTSSGSEPGRRPAPSTSCPRCLAPLAYQRIDCFVCGWPDDLPAGERREEVLLAIRRQLLQFRNVGALGETAYAQVLAELNDAFPAPESEPPVEAPVEAVVVMEPAVPAKSSAEEPPVEGTPAELESDSEHDEAQDAAQSPPDFAIEPASIAPADVALRARQFAAKQQEYQQAKSELAVETPGGRHETFTKLMGAFLEEKNIRWGELVGGLLIVCCSIALVISFWSEIAGRPFLKFFVFNGVSTALFGVGFYTEHRWKIHTTSLGLLIIAVLLVPLNFLAIAAFTQQSPPTDFLSLSGEAVSLALFSCLCYFGAKTLTPGVPLLATIGIMLPCLMQLLTRRFVDESAALGLLYGLALVPLCSFVGVTSFQIDRLRRQPPLSEHAANRLFTLLGIVAYSTLLPLALLLYKSGAAADALHRLAPLVVLCGVPALATGLLFWRGATDGKLSASRTAGVSIGVLGAMIMAAAVLLAWPDPATLLPTALVNAVVFTLVALRFRIAPAHLVAGLGLMLAWLVGAHLMLGNVKWELAAEASLFRVLLSASSGNVLLPFVVVWLGIAALWSRTGRQADAAWYAVTAGVAAVAGLLLVTAFGFGRAGDPAGATWTFACYALAAATAAVTTNQRAVAWAASVLLLGTLIQGLVFRYGSALPLEQPWTTAFLLHAAIVTAAALVLGRWWRSGRKELRASLIQSAQIASIVGACLIGREMLRPDWVELTWNLVWLSLIWLALTMVAHLPRWFVAFQIAGTLAVMCGITAVVETRAWYVSAEHPWLDPWFLQMQGIALACCAMTWIGLRISSRSLPNGDDVSSAEREPIGPVNRLRAYLSSSVCAFDRVCEVAAVALLVFLATYAVAPGVAQELAPMADRSIRAVPTASNFELASMPHEHAAGAGAWLLLLAVSATLVAGLWESNAVWRGLGLLLCAAAVAPLAATWWAGSVAVASALRWMLAAFVLAGSVPVWNLDRLKSRATRLKIKLAGRDVPVDAASAARGILLAAAFLPYAAMAVYVSLAVVQQAGVPASMAALLRGLAVVLLIALLGMAVLSSAANSMRHRTGDGSRSTLVRWSTHGQSLLLLLGAGPLLITWVFVVGLALRQHPLLGPEPDAWFRSIGWSVSYGIPLVVIAASLLGHAISQRSSGYAFVAGLLMNVVATVAYLLRLSRQGRPLDPQAWIEVAQCNCAVAAIVALVWLAAMAWYRRRIVKTVAAAPTVQQWPLLLVTQVVLAVALCAVTLLPATIGLVIEPDPSAWITAAGSAWGWGALLLALTSAVFVFWGTSPTLSAHQLGWLLVVAGVMIALTATHWDNGNWLSYHLLLLCCSCAAWTMSAAHWLLKRRDSSLSNSPANVGWSISLSAVAVFLALRGLVGDPAAPWWTVGVLLAMAALLMRLAWLAHRRSLLWAMGLLVNLATSLAWLEVGPASVSFGVSVVQFILINVVAAAIAGLVSVIVEYCAIARATSLVPRFRPIGFHRVVSWACIAALALTTTAGIVADQAGSPLDVSWWLVSSALAAAVLCTIACLWDRDTRWPIVSFYCLGLVASGVLLDTLNVESRNFWWFATLLAASFSLVSSYLWSRRAELQQLAARWGVPLALQTTASQSERSQTTLHGLGWLVSANGTLSVLVVVLVCWGQLTYPDFVQRMTSAYALLVQALALGLLARGAVRSALQYAALLVGVLFAVAFGWAWLWPDMPGPLLHRAVVAAVAVAAAIPAYGFGIVKLLRGENEWTRAAQKLLPWLAATSTGLLLLVLGIETYEFLEYGESQIHWTALVAVAAALGGLSLAALAAAVLPGRDPLGLSERGRTLYVYAAELMLGLLFLHIRVTMPWLFRGWFIRFWPLVVMGIAFLGVGFAEYCHRRRQRVLSEPLENTGALLPVLSVVGVWILPSQVNYSFILLSVGALYAVLSLLRKSLLFGILSILAVNGSLWYFLQSVEGLGLLQHPQLWLIPPALCVLVGAYLNRESLSDQELTTVRYMAAIVIYVASTADVFLNGVAEAPWLPLVLGGLSLVGIFAGIVLRVRAFLYLGTSFLLVALLTIIWYAAVELDRTWIWWVSGIVTGALIIAFFGLFEKKRDEMLRLVEQLKQWEP